MNGIANCGFTGVFFTSYQVLTKSWNNTWLKKTRTIRKSLLLQQIVPVFWIRHYLLHVDFIYSFFLSHALSHIVYSLLNSHANLIHADYFRTPRPLKPRTRGIANYSNRALKDLYTMILPPPNHLLSFNRSSHSHD